MIVALVKVRFEMAVDVKLATAVEVLNAVLVEEIVDTCAIWT